MMFVVFSKDINEGPNFLEQLITPATQDLFSSESRPTIPDGQLHRIDMRIYRTRLPQDVDAYDVPHYLHNWDLEQPPVTEFVLAIVDPIKLQEILKAITRHIKTHGGKHHVLNKGYMLAMPLRANQICYTMILHFTAIDFEAELSG